MVRAARSQDFTLINQEVFAFPQSAEFVDFVRAASGGGGALLKYLLKRYGLVRGPARLLKTLRTFGKPFSGFATETLFTAAPLACGPYAVRVRLVPNNKSPMRLATMRTPLTLTVAMRTDMP